MRKRSFAYPLCLYVLSILLTILSVTPGVAQSAGGSHRQIRPAWSPLGDRYGYLSDKSGIFQLCIYDPASGRETQITNSREPVQQFKWSPSGGQLVYLTREGLTVIREDGSGSMRLNTTLATPTFFDWTPDGRGITYSCAVEGNNSDICLKSLYEHFDIDLTKHEAPDRNFAWSPDGSSIAFGSERNGSLDIFLMEFKSNQLHQLTDLPNNVIDPVFSPEGDQLVFNYDRDGQNRHFDVYSYTFATGRLLKLSEGYGYNLPLWFPDGHHLLINTNHNGEWAFYRRGIDGGDEEKLGDGLAFSIHPFENKILIQFGEAGRERIKMVEVD